MQKRDVAALIVAAAAATTLLAGAARAGEHGRGEDDAHERHEHHDHHERRGRERRDGERGPARGGDRAGAARIDPAYAKECGACHLAYPPDLLPAASWTKLMSGLDRHFGQNAELEPEVRAGLERWLVERAGSRADGAPLRATETAWFSHKHRKVAGAAERPSVRSLANCAACHPAAERWDFDEDGVRIPSR